MSDGPNTVDVGECQAISRGRFFEQIPGVSLQNMSARLFAFEAYYHFAVRGPRVFAISGFRPAGGALHGTEHALSV